MSKWSEISALCDLAIEAIDRRQGARGAKREAAWAAPKALLEAVDSLLREPLSEAERESFARLEFDAIESAKPGGGLWPVSGKAWRAGVARLGAAAAAGMALGRVKAVAKAAAGAKAGDHHERREDVGGKLLRLMRQGGLFWLDEDGRGGHVGPTGRAVSDWALAAHGRWCAQLGVLAEGDWEAGINAYGFGVWLEEREAGAGGRFERWGQRLLEASEAALSRFGRLPRLPPRTGMSMPSWTLLENYAGHEGGEGVMAHSWSWSSRYPLIGVNPWDLSWCESAGWPAEGLSDARLGRARVISRMLDAQGRSDLRGEFERWQGRWASQIEGEEIERGLGQAGAATPAKASDRPRRSAL